MKIEDLKQPIYLFPFTAEAALMHHILKNHGVRIAGFLDNKKSLHSESYDGIPFMSPETAAGRDAGATVVICGYRHYGLSEKLETLGFEPVKIESILRKDDVESSIHAIDKAKFNELAPKQKYRLNRIDFEIKNVMLTQDKIDIDDSLILNAVEVSITEKCTLKCAECGAMMQYYIEPKHISADQVMEDIDMVMHKADFVRNFSVIGGEPFLHPQLEEILNHIGRYSQNIGAFRITTNGTIVLPDKVMRVIKSSGVFVRISNYGVLSRKLPDLEGKLRQYQIPYQTVEFLTWYKMNHLIYNSELSAQEKYDDCYSRIVCNTVMNGRLYLCGFLAQTENMHAIPYDTRNHVELGNPETTKDTIRKYIEGEVAPPGCTYCSGHGRDMREIPAAEQIKEPLPYKSFTETYPPDFK